MAVFFQSLRSSSAGNALALWTRTSSILIDCGISLQRECRSILDAHVRTAGGLDAVVVSHAHADHMSHASLRVLGRERVPIHADRQVIGQLRQRYAPEDWLMPPDLRAIPGGGLEAGDFALTPFEVPHAPGTPTFGFAIEASDGRSSRRIVVCTDFHDYKTVVARFADCDFIFLEANHDRALLREHPNPSSWFHLNNVKCASLLHQAVNWGTRPPGAVMLGHLSEERNRGRLAVGEVESTFRRHGTRMAFHLDTAPAFRPSEAVEV
jgi:phosphoribosyl 1,2-cyclic phosphodiesterase